MNTGSPTEDGLVGIDDAQKSIIWGLYFIQAQGYEVTNNILMQENKSTILLAKNVRFYSSKITKHSKHRYFIIKDNIGKGEIIIQYCPTGGMLVNINTKALQESLFYKMRGRLVSIIEDYDDDIERLNTHSDLQPSQEYEDDVSDKDPSVLAKAGDVVKFLEVTQNTLPNATRKNKAVVAALIFTTTMAQ